MKKLSQILSTKGLFWLAIFLVVFIPLYPKIPLFSPIEEYIVRVRLEDVFVLIAAIWWAVLLIRKKITWKSPITFGIFAYIIVGILSTISAVFITQTVPMQPLHLAKTLLHLFRYIEYFSIFFVVYGTIQTLKQAKLLVGLLAITVLAAAVYGYGQKYYYWPVYSTMNREFSKGIRLYLTEHARVQSTFAGHYDLAAFLVIALPLILAMTAQTKTKTHFLVLVTAFVTGTWLLIVSASRTPFAAYIAGVTLVIIWQGWLKAKWKDKLIFWLKRFLTVYAMIFVVVYYFGTELLDRLSFALSNEETGVSVDIRQSIDDLLKFTFLPNTQTLGSWLKVSSPPPQAISTEEAEELIADETAVEKVVASASDQPPVTKKPATVPKDVYVEVPEPQGEEDVVLEDGSVERRTIHRERVYSDCALSRELSLCIRLESLWPWAMDGFYANPILGTGYATLNKQFVDEFTIAESTDNNFLRTLGETGALGFITFYGTILVAIALMFKYRHSHNTFRQSFFVGLSAGTIGLLINAVYIDVFAASKVAYAFWSMMGLAAALIKMEQQNSAKA